MSKSRTLEYGDLFYNEMCALGRAEVYKVPRVIKYVQPPKTADDICLILEYAWVAVLAVSQPVLKLCTVHASAFTCTHTSSRPSSVQVGAWADSEQAYVFKTHIHSGDLGAASAGSCCAAPRSKWPPSVHFMLLFCSLTNVFQLNMQTLEELHMTASMCHLDLTITNVMLQDDRSNGWDVLRRIDFGFAQIFNKGKFASPQPVLQGCSPSCLPALVLLAMHY